MPAVNANLNILSASANYTAGDWASVGAQGSLDIQAGAALKRGFDVGVGATSLVKLDASIQKFLAIDAHALATASAGVRAQLQTPIDLFAEAGAALRLQAQAQAAVGVQLGIGLTVGDFLAIVDSDPKLRGAPAQLVRVLLEETTLGGGVLAKAAVAAMAYVNVSATGRLVASGTTPPGFTVAAEAGAGLGAGAGIKGYVNFGVSDPRNLVRRSVDVAVGSTLDDLVARTADRRLRQLLEELRTPLKIALRTTFEVGLELAANGGAFSGGDGQVLSLRAVQVVLEEAQRAILERAVRWAADQVRQALGSLAFGASTWNASLADRTALAAHLNAFPAEPFAATAANRAYWSRAIDLVSSVYSALGGLRNPTDPGVEALATVYAATQLLFIAVDRISNASARASVIGAPPAVAVPAFSGTVAAPGPLLKRHINLAIGQPANAAMTQQALVTYLAEGRVLALVAASFPELETIASIVAGETPGALGAGFSTILSNIGAFAPVPGGGVDPAATLAVILRGLRAYSETRLKGELVPALDAQLAGAPPELRTYLDEVLFASLDFATNEVFGALLDWANGSAGAQVALREACSATLMQLFGRSLIVTADAVLARLMAGMSDAFRDLAGHVDDAGGIAQKLAAIAQPSGLSRADIAELLAEHCLIVADAARPLEPERRARIRELMYRVIDFGSADPSVALSQQLLADQGARNIEAGSALALEFGALFADRLVDLIKAWLAHVGAKALAEVAAVVDAIVAVVQQWIDDLERLARDLARRLDALVAEVTRLASAMEQQFAAALDSAAAMIAALGATGTARARLRDGLRDAVLHEAMSVLSGLPGYDLVPGWAIAQVESALGAAVVALLPDALLNPVLDAVRGPALAAADFLGDLHDIQPGNDLAAAVVDLFLDRISDAVTNAFGGGDPRLALAIDFTARVTQQTPLGPLTVSFHVAFDLGSVRIPLGDVIDAVRAAARSLDAAASAAETVASRLASAIRAELDLDAAQTEHALAQTSKTDADTALVETRPAALDAAIVSPGDSSIVEGSLLIDIHLPGVPASYLGLKPEQAERVYVWLNRQLLPNASFAVRSLGGGPAGGVAPAAGASSAPDVAVFPWQRTPSPVRAVHPLLEARSSLLQRAGRLPAGALATGAIAGRGAGSIAAPVQPADGLRLGRPVRASERAAAEAAAAPGLGLLLRLPPERMLAGTNTLVVAVVDGRGRYRIQRQATFVALPPEQRPAPPAGVRPGKKVPAPADAVLDLGALPPSLRDGLAAAIGRPGLETVRAPRVGKKLQPAGALGPWMGASRARRAKEIETERVRAVAALQESRKPVQALRDAFVGRRLRGAGAKETK